MQTKREPLQLLRVDQAAEFLNVKPSTIRAWLLNRKLPKVRIGARCVRIPRQALEQMVAECTRWQAHKGGRNRREYGHGRANDSKVDGPPRTSRVHRQDTHTARLQCPGDEVMQIPETYRSGRTTLSYQRGSDRTEKCRVWSDKSVRPNKSKQADDTRERLSRRPPPQSVGKVAETGVHLPNSGLWQPRGTARTPRLRLR